LSNYFTVPEEPTIRMTAPLSWNTSGEGIATQLNFISETEPNGDFFDWIFVEDLGDGEYLLDVKEAEVGGQQKLPDGVETDNGSLAGHLIWEHDEIKYKVPLTKGGCASTLPEGSVAPEGDRAGVVPDEKRVLGGRGDSTLRPLPPPPAPVFSEFSHDLMELDEDNLSEAWAAHQSLDEIAAALWQHTYEAGYDLYQHIVTETHTFAYGFNIPLIDPVIFLVDPEEENPVREGFFGWRFFLKINGVYVGNFRGGWMFGFMTKPNRVRTHAIWRNQAVTFGDGTDLPPLEEDVWTEAASGLFLPNSYELEGGEELHNSRLYEGAKALGTLPAHEGQSITVNEGDLVSIQARALGLEFVSTGTTEEPDNRNRAVERMGWLDSVGPVLPRLPYSYRIL